jgi:hypothetical protein
MDQSEGMSRFMDHLLGEPLKEETVIGRHPIAFVVQAV